MVLRTVKLTGERVYNEAALKERKEYIHVYIQFK